MLFPIRLAPAALALALLSACGNDAGEEVAEPADGGNVSGEVLDGSISDEMIPLDELRSRAPQAEEVPEDGAATGSAGAGGAAPAPAADPATEDEPVDAAPVAEAEETPEGEE